MAKRQWRNFHKPVSFTLDLKHLVTFMSKFDEMREDYRLARLNNNAYRVLFVFLDLCKGLFKVTVLGCFAFGIWYLTHGYETWPPGSARNVPEPPVTEQLELTSERIAQLKAFADKNRREHIASESGTTTVQAVESPVVVIADAQVDNTQPDNTQADDTQFDNGASNSDGIPAPVEPAPVSVVVNTFEAPVTLPADNFPDNNRAGTDISANPTFAEQQPSELSFPAVTQVVSAGASAGILDAAWIRSQSEDSFLIQIGSTTNRPFLVRFEKQLPDTQPSAVFEMLIGEQAEHVLTYGMFDSREQATGELARLSATARKYGAYVRQLSVIQQQIRDLGNDLALVQNAVNVANNVD